MKQNISSDNRVDEFARELAIALRRITGRQTENKSANLPTPKKDDKKGHLNEKDGS